MRSRDEIQGAADILAIQLAALPDAPRIDQVRREAAWAALDMCANLFPRKAAVLEILAVLLREFILAPVEDQERLNRIAASTNALQWALRI